MTCPHRGHCNSLTATSRCWPRQSLQRHLANYREHDIVAAPWCGSSMTCRQCWFAGWMTVVHWVWIRGSWLINGPGNPDLLTLKLVCESHQRLGTFLANLGTLSLWVLELFAMYAMDGRTDGRIKATITAAFRTGGDIIRDIPSVRQSLVCLTTVRFVWTTTV